MPHSKDREYNVSPCRVYNPSNPPSGVARLPKVPVPTGYLTDVTQCGYVLFAAMPDPWNPSTNPFRLAEILADEQAFSKN